MRLDTALWYLQEIVAFVLYLTMLPSMLREFVNRKKVTIVNYHDPSAKCIEQHLRSIGRRYNLISMDRLQECLSSRALDSLPPKSMVITFDDGHCGNARLFAILKKYGVPSVIYVVSGLTNTRRRFWWQLDLEKGRLRMLKKITNDEREWWLRDHCGYTFDREYYDRCALSDSELKDFMDHGGTIGGHSLSHPNLRKCDETTLAKEVAGAKMDLETKMTTEARYFAYPGGYWDERVKEAVMRAGYANARTIDFGWVTPDTDPWALPCIGIGDKAGVYKALCQASGLWHFIFRTQSGMCRSLEQIKTKG